MERFKKIGFFIVFFFTVFQVMGDSVIQFNKKSIIVENQQNDQPCSQAQIQELDQAEDEQAMDIFNSCVCILLTKESIISSSCGKKTKVDCSFWQPPQNV